MIINLWRNEKMNEWRWSLTETGLMSQHTGTQREELVLPDDQLLQVTDLVGLKQTGYVNGRPYYGSTFSQDGILYAGVYETTGDLVQVYATLQESVDNQVTTRASAILRQGSDVTSNDPRLNIPNTPDNLI